MLRASSRAWDREEGRQAHQQKPWKSGLIGEVIFSDPLPDISDDTKCYHQYYLVSATLFIHPIHTSYRWILSTGL